MQAQRAMAEALITQVGRPLGAALTRPEKNSSNSIHKRVPHLAVARKRAVLRTMVVANHPGSSVAHRPMGNPRAAAPTAKPIAP